MSEDFYESLILPESFKNFHGYTDLTKQEAKQFFQWYTSKISERIEYLQDWLYDDLDCDVELNYTPESLKALWGYFLTKISYYELSPKELGKKLDGLSPELSRYVFKYEWTEETDSMAGDIAMYFGEVVRKNMGGINWGYFTGSKVRDSVNEPVLLGFPKRMNLNPRNIVVNCMRSYVRAHESGNDDTEWLKLYSIYKVWEKFL